MAFWKRRTRGSFVPTSSEERVPVICLGQHSITDGVDIEHALLPLDVLYSNYKQGKGAVQRATLEVTMNGLVVYKLKGFTQPPSQETDLRTLIPSTKIQLTSTDPARPKIFFIVVREEDAGSGHECHAFLCDLAASARRLTNRLGDVSQNDSSTLSYMQTISPMNNRPKGMTRSQSFNVQPQSRARPAAVSALKITMNINDTMNREPIRDANQNTEVARILAKRDRLRSSKMGGSLRVAPTELGRFQLGARAPQSAKIQASHKAETIQECDFFTEPGKVCLPSDKAKSPQLLRECNEQIPNKGQKLKDQQPKGPESSPVEHPKACANRKSTEETKENQVLTAPTAEEEPKINKRKSVRFSDNTETI